MRKLRGFTEEIAVCVVLVFVIGPFWVMRACASGPAGGRYCSIERTIDYLNGADAWLWVPAGLLMIAIIGICTCKEG